MKHEKRRLCKYPAILYRENQRSIQQLAGSIESRLHGTYTLSRLGIYSLLKGMPLYLLHDEPFLWVGEYKPIKDQFKVGRDEIKSSGYVVDTLAAALWCFKQTNNYKDCIRLAVGLGGDTDTIAAVAGGLAGIAYGCGGENGIPYDWIDTIAEKDWIAEICGYDDSIF